MNIRLLEYESKEIFKRFNIPLANYIIINKEDNVDDKISHFMFPAIIKSQIAIGSRKKAGFIKIAQTKEEAKALCLEFFNKMYNNYSVEAILIEELVSIQQEFYVSITLDTSGREFFIIASKEGGIDIEEVAITHPELIIKESFSLIDGFTNQLARKIAEQLGFSNELLNSAIDIFLKLWNMVIESEALLIEINPLVLTPTGLIAIDAKMLLDDNASYRNSTIKIFQEKKMTDLQKTAKEAGFSFIELKGDIGILANGAGLTMALLDILAQLGLSAANFLDVGGGASKERVYKALELIIRLKPKCIFINIFGGITRCDTVAEAIIQALQDFKDPPPLIIRLTGTNEKEGISLLKNKGINAFQDILGAVENMKELLI